MDINSTQTILNVTLTGLLFLWMIAFTLLAFRNTGAAKEDKEGQTLPDAPLSEPRIKIATPRYTAFQDEGHNFRHENSGEVEAVTI